VGPYSAASILGMDPGSKALRFSACLAPLWPLTLTYCPASKVLSISGCYGVVK
jgi:hypothetical protein